MAVRRRTATSQGTRFGHRVGKETAGKKIEASAEEQIRRGKVNAIAFVGWRDGWLKIAVA